MRFPENGKKDNFGFFFPFAVLRRLLSESSGHGLNCNIFEYLMMYQFDFTDIIIKILYHIFLRYFCGSDVLMMAHIILYCSKRYKVIG